MDRFFITIILKLKNHDFHFNSTQHDPALVMTQFNQIMIHTPQERLKFLKYYCLVPLQLPVFFRHLNCFS